MMSKISFIALYGVSFGMILFTMSVGLAVTMGVMRVINLAHGAFAAAGAYFSVGLMAKAGFPLPLAIVTATILVATSQFADRTVVLSSRSMNGRSSIRSL